MKRGAAVALLALSFPAAAADGPYMASVFFSAEEIETINLPTATAPPALAARDIHLDAVFYYGPKNWAVWIDDVRWTPETTRGDLKIIAVEPNAIRLGWDPADPARIVTLRPHQTFQSSTGRIVEGRMIKIKAD
ncbi:MAG: hypothetical protein AB7H77_04205 [Bdellovibrionales bacterium]